MQNMGGWPSGFAIRNGMFVIQTPLGARPDLGTQSGYKVFGQLWVKIEETH